MESVYAPGVIFYNEELRKCAEENLALTQLIGKYHVPSAKVAYLFSNREVERLAYPWKPDASKVLSMGYYGWYCALEYPAAAVMESDFLKDCAGQFAVVIDGNTQIMDAADGRGSRALREKRGRVCDPWPNRPTYGDRSRRLADQPIDRIQGRGDRSPFAGRGGNMGIRAVWLTPCPATASFKSNVGETAKPAPMTFHMPMDCRLKKSLPNAVT